MEVTRLGPPAAPHLVVVGSPRLRFVEAIEAEDASGRAFGDQLDAVLDRVEAARAAAGDGTVVAKALVFLLSMLDVEAVRAGLESRFGGAMPAVTFVQVDALAQPGARIQCEVVLVL